MKKRNICRSYLMIIFAFLVFLIQPAFAGTGKHTGYNRKELSRILKESTTDQIMAALEPIIEMPEEKILDEIETPVEHITGNTFCLMVSSAEFPEKGEKFIAFYGIPVSALFGITSHREHIHHMANITGLGATPHDALVDLIMRLSAKGLLDPGSLVKKLSKHLAQ